MGLEDQIKRAMSSGKVLIGTKETERAVLLGQAKYVIMSSDLEAQAKERLVYLLGLDKIPYKELNYTYKEFGEVIGKDHPVGVLAILDEGKAKIEF